MRVGAAWIDGWCRLTGNLLGPHGERRQEKYEQDLKKEIKKLQRHRDQIKTWLGMNDVKDKKGLTEVRKRIESKMEQFKVGACVFCRAMPCLSFPPSSSLTSPSSSHAHRIQICEKEAKTKMFSKEGLAREQKVDPKEAAKNKTRDWLGNFITELNTQMESFDADLERLSAGKGKSKNKDEITALEASLAGHKRHVAKLEQIIRLMDNDLLDPEKIDEVSVCVCVCWLACVCAGWPLCVCVCLLACVCV